MLDKTENVLFSCDLVDSNNHIKILSGNFEETDEFLLLCSRKFLKSVLIEEIGLISTYIRNRWIFIQNIVLLDSNPPFKEVVQARIDVNEGLKALYHATHNLSESVKYKIILEFIYSISASVLSLDTFEEKVLMRLCHSTKQRVHCPVYEYFHCYLDIQLYILLIRMKCECSRNVTEENVTQIMNNLVLLTRKYFVKEFVVENSSFLCPCVGNLWKVVYFVIVKKFSCDMFWEKLNMVLKEDSELFNFWLIKDLVTIDCSDIEGSSTIYTVVPSFEFIREKFTTSLNSSSDISKHLKMLYPLISELWPNDKKLEFLLIVWDHFSKRLNISSKYKSGMHISSIEFTEILDIIIFSPKDCDDEFEIFIGLLNNYLNQQPNHWGKVKCRIFSQLSPFKIGNLDEVGLYKVFQLLIGLMAVNPEELSKRITSVFGSLKENMVTSSIVNIYVSFVSYPF